MSGKGQGSGPRKTGVRGVPLGGWPPVITDKGREWLSRHSPAAPKANEGYWAAKVARNVARDADTERRLDEAGRMLLAVWEHEDPARPPSRSPPPSYGAASHMC